MSKSRKSLWCPFSPSKVSQQAPYVKAWIVSITRKKQASKPLSLLGMLFVTGLVLFQGTWQKLHR